MANNKLLIKRSNVVGKVPTTGDLQTGELALNFKDKKIFTKEPSGTIIELSRPLPAGVGGQMLRYSGGSWTATSAIVIDGTGKVGIGVTPTYKLHVSGAIGANSIATPDGTAAAPSYTFQSDPDSGMYRLTNNQIGFTTAGKLRLTVKNGVCTVTNGVSTDGTIAGNTSTAAGGTIMRQHVCSQAEYNALTPNGNTLYIIL